MKIIVFVFFILLVFASSTFAGEIYTYTDKDGNTVISNTPIPEKYKSKVKKLESYRDITPAESSQKEQEIREGNVDKALKDCLDGAENNYVSRIESECRKLGKPDNCELDVSFLSLLKENRELLKAECHKAAKK